MQKTPFYLLTGFLGSGKTTLLKRIIDATNSTKKLAIIQNEFAPANIDGQELKRTASRDFHLLEVNNGSVFCVCLLSGFTKSLQKFIEQYDPDIVFMESSGLSDPVGIGEIFQYPSLSEKLYFAGSICIVDAMNIQKTGKMIQRTQHQISLADIVIINKEDLIENTSRVHEIVNDLNPLGKKYTTSYCNIDILKVLETVENTFKLIPEKPQNNRPEINSCVLKSTRPMEFIHLDHFISQLAMKSYRSKGYVITTTGKCYAIQTVFNQVHKEEMKIGANSTEIIAMGYDITVQELRLMYQSYLAN